MVDSCETLVVDQASISNNQANLGGGLAVLHVQVILARRQATCKSNGGKPYLTPT
jgi:hypothetical protein